MRQLVITKSITNRDSQSVEKYLQQISKVPLLLPEEEVELTIRVKQGDKKALEKLTNANLRFVVSVAKQYQHRGLSLPDLINEGNLGLITAIQRFDETRGFKLISYAVWRIRQSILKALGEQGRLVRLPMNKVGTHNKARKEFSKFQQEFEREPTDEELAEILDITPLEASSILGNAARHVSLDEAFGEESDGNRYDVMENENADSPEEETDRQDLKEDIRQCLHLLNENQKKVIILYYGLEDGEGKSLEDIGEIIFLSTERVRQIKDRALSRLQMSMKKLGYNNGKDKTVVNSSAIRKNIHSKKEGGPTDTYEQSPSPKPGKTTHNNIAPPNSHPSSTTTTPFHVKMAVPQITKVTYTAGTDNILEPDLLEEKKETVLDEIPQIDENNRFRSIVWKIAKGLKESFLSLHNLEERLARLDLIINDTDRSIAKHLLLPDHWNDDIEKNMAEDSNWYQKVRSVSIDLLDILGDAPTYVIDISEAKKYIDLMGFDIDSTRIAYNFFVEQEVIYDNSLKANQLYDGAWKYARDLQEKIYQRYGRKVQFLQEHI